MDTTQLDEKITAPGFLGAFPYDQIPQKPNNGSFSVVLNTDPTDGPGEHWIALVYKTPHFYFCDSYGRPFSDPTFPSAFSATVKKIIGKTVYKTNTKLLQQFTSNACGDYCVYFIQELAKNSLKKVSSVFSTDLKRNDRYVVNYTNKLAI